MTADSSEIRKLSVDLRGASREARSKMRLVIQKTCADTKADAQALAPVDTGALRSSITYKTQEVGSRIVGEVGPTVDYGVYVEMGTSRMGPQPYMRPAFDRRAPLLEQAAAQLKIGEIE